MAVDSVLKEIRQIREALAERFNYDLRAIVEDARKRQAASGRRVVSFAPKSAGETTDTPLPDQEMQPTPSPEQVL